MSLPQKTDLATLLPSEASDSMRAMARAALAGGETARNSLARRSAADMVLKGRHDYQTDGDIAAERVPYGKFTMEQVTSSAPAWF